MAYDIGSSFSHEFAPTIDPQLLALNASFLPDLTAYSSHFENADDASMEARQVRRTLHSVTPSVSIPLSTRQPSNAKRPDLTASQTVAGNMRLPPITPETFWTLLETSKEVKDVTSE